jgi:hypothetical protein
MIITQWKPQLAGSLHFRTNCNRTAGARLLGVGDRGDM